MALKKMLTINENIKITQDMGKNSTVSDLYMAKCVGLLDCLCSHSHMSAVTSQKWVWVMQ